MRRASLTAWIVLLGGLVPAVPGQTDAPVARSKTDDGTRKAVLVELFTSQG
jgi:hypothetical protein